MDVKQIITGAKQAGRASSRITKGLIGGIKKTATGATRRFLNVLNQATNYGNFSSWFIPRNIFTSTIGGTLATNETIFAAVSRRSNSMASMPIKVYRDYDVSRTRTSDLIEASPNPNMTGFDFIRTLQVCADTSGNAYALKDYDPTFQLRALWILDPNRVIPVIEKNTRELWYRIEGEDNTYYAHNFDVIHIKHINSMATPYLGISPIDVLKNTVDFDGKVKQFSLDLLDTAIKASFLLKMTGQVGEPKKAEIRENFRRFYAENGGVIFQEGGYTVEPLERKFIDAKVFEVEKITRTRVATVYNMPVHLLGETDGINYASREHMSIEYVQDTIVPIARQYEQEFNRKLLTEGERRQGFYFKFNVNALLRGDMKTRGDFYFRQIRSGMLTPNEGRALEERPPLAGGDQLLASKDLTPLIKLNEVNDG